MSKSTRPRLLEDLDEIGIPPFEALITPEQIDRATAPGQPIFINRRVGLGCLTKNRDELFEIAMREPQMTARMLAASTAALASLEYEKEMLGYAQFRLVLALGHLEESAALDEAAQSNDSDRIHEIADGLPESGHLTEGADG